MAAAPGVRRSELGDALRACRSAFIGVGAMSCMINLLYLTGSIFMLEVYDRVLPSRSVPTLVGLAILATGLYIAQGSLDLIRGRILGRIGTSLDEALNARVFDTVVRLPLMVGGRNEGLQPLRDLDNVRSFLSSMGPGALFDLPWLPFYLAICFAFHVMIGLTALVGAIILVSLTVAHRIPVARAGARGHGPGSASQRSGGHQPAERRSAGGDGNVRTAGPALERGQPELSCGQSARQRRRRRPWRGCQGPAHDLAVGRARGRRLSRYPPGSHRGHHHRGLDPERAGAGAGRSRHRALERFRRRAAELATAEPVARSVPAATAQTLLQNPSSRLSVEGVSIVPPGDQKVIVQDVNFALQAGNGLGVIGPSGSGKSSLVRALVGVWQPVRGKVRLDGAALDQWSSDLLGHHVGYLPQDVELFAGTVAQNIARFDPDASAEAIITAAKEAGVHEMIIKMREGYDTQIGEQGAALSAGQAQRVALARALYGSPFLIVLDEPNSNLDTEGDEALTRAVRAARERGAIVVVVAHRPIGIEAVDQLLVLKDGRMQAFGPKETVLGQVLQRVSPPTPIKIVSEGGVIKS